MDIISNEKKNVSKRVYEKSKDIYNDWKKNSISGKLIVVFDVITAIILVNLFFLVDETKFEENIFIDLKSVSFGKYVNMCIIVFFLFFSVLSFVKSLLETNEVFKISEWITKNEIDCYPVLNKEFGSLKRTPEVGQAFLIKERPETKNIFLVKIIFKYVINIVLTIALCNLFWILIPGLHFFEDSLPLEELYHLWLKPILKSSDAIFLYVIIGVNIIFNMVIIQILNNKEKKLLDDMSQNIEDEK